MLDMIPNPVPLSILAVTIVMSILAFKHEHLMKQWLLTPYNISRSGSYRTFITSGFIHAAFNIIIVRDYSRNFPDRFVFISP